MKKLLSVMLSGITAGALIVTGSVTAQAATPTQVPQTTGATLTTTNAIDLTVLVAIPSDLTGIDNPWTDEHMRTLLANSNTYWSTMTERQIGLSVQEAPIKVVPTSAKSTDRAIDFTATVAAEQGIDVKSSWKGLIIFTPSPHAVALSGMKAHAAAYSNIDSTGGRALISGMGFESTAPQDAAATHEIGHFFRNGHANRLACGDGSSDSVETTDGSAWANNTCETVEYDDTNDVMGAPSIGSLNTALADMQGFMKPTDITTITPTDTPTDYTLKPWGDKTITNKSIKIVSSDTYMPYYVELRQNVGLDTKFAVDLRSGVKIVKRGLDNSRTSVVLDPTPNVTKRGLDGAQTWQVGDVFINAEKTFGVRVKSIVNGSAVVTVTKITPATAASYLEKNKNTAPRVLGSMDEQDLPYYSRSGILTVTSKDAAGNAIPGTVTVKEGTVVKGTATVGTTGVARISLSRAVSAGEHTYTLSHSNPTVNTGQVTHVVAKANTTTAVINAVSGVITSPISSTQGGTTNELNIKISSATGYAPTGTVLVLKNNVTIGTLPLVAANNGSLTYSLPSSPSSADVFTVKYSGTVNSEPSESKVLFAEPKPEPVKPQPLPTPTPTPAPTKPPVVVPTPAPATGVVSVSQPAVTVTTSPSSARVKWVTPQVVGKISKYAIIAKGPNGYEKLFYASSNATEVVYTGLTAGTKYTFETTVEAVSLDGTKKTAATTVTTALTGGGTVAPTPTPTKPPVVVPTPTPAPTTPPVVIPTPTPTPTMPPATGISAVKVSQPANLKATGMTNTSVYVTWVKPAVVGKISRFVVTVTNNKGYNRTYYTTSAQSMVTGLTAGTYYNIVVTAEAVSVDGKNKATASAAVLGLTKGGTPSAPPVVITPGPTTPPVVTPPVVVPPVVTPPVVQPGTVSKVQNVQNFTSRTSVRVVWAKPAVMPGILTRYTITLKNSAGYSKTLLTKTTTVSYAGLTPNTAYTVIISATSTDGNKVLTSADVVSEIRTLK
jgi:hypothetical protein